MTKADAEMGRSWGRWLRRLGLRRGSAAAPPPSWGLVIDLDLCDGCGKCSTACASEHGLESDRSFMRRLGAERDDGEALSIPVPCLHCELAPCLEACPTGASRGTRAGLLMTDADKCTCCGSCAAACPHEVLLMERVEGRLLPRRCDLCEARLARVLDAGAAEGRPPRDEELRRLPACAAACPAAAITFGDLDDPGSAAGAGCRSGRGRPLLGSSSKRSRVVHVAGSD